MLNISQSDISTSVLFQWGSCTDNGKSYGKQLISLPIAYSHIQYIIFGTQFRSNGVLSGDYTSTDTQSNRGSCNKSGTPSEIGKTSFCIPKAYKHNWATLGY